VIWNIVFDNEIRLATDAYLERQGAHDAGRGPSVKMDSVMGPAKRRGVQRATVCAAAGTLAGLALTYAVTRKR
jgi:hypothetical protein